MVTTGLIGPVKGEVERQLANSATYLDGIGKLPTPGSEAQRHLRPILHGHLPRHFHIVIRRDADLLIRRFADLLFAICHLKFVS